MKPNLLKEGVVEAEHDQMLKASQAAPNGA